MRLLSAAEAITPSIERTKAVLFQPFRKGRTWKLSATAYLGRASTIFLPFPLFYLFFLPAVHRWRKPNLHILHDRHRILD